MTERLTPSEATQDLVDSVRDRLGYYPSVLKQALENYALPAIFKAVSQRPKEAVELYEQSIGALKDLLLNMLPQEPEEGDFVEIEWPVEILEQKVPAAIGVRSDPEKVIEALRDQSLTRISVLALGAKPGVTPTEKELLWLEEEMLWREPTVGEFAAAGRDLIFPYAVHQDNFSGAWMLDRNALADLRTVFYIPSALESELTGVWAYNHRDGVSLPNPWELAATRNKIGDQFGRVGIIITDGMNGPILTLFTRPAQDGADIKELYEKYLEAARNLRKRLALASPYEPLARAAKEDRWADVDAMVDRGMWSTFDQRAREPVDSRASGRKFREILEIAYREQLVELGAHLYEHGEVFGEDLSLTLTEFVLKYQDRLRSLK
ncbi:hypothetical protein A3D81_02905 [Candidatus Curtissbacteria bacterium RIFCSPHIGHO2_02_FULL_40_17]|uniref:Uncharacterized protein n=3 Tax=Candidatus Curtissiibacteriota TaxID=1752717 RepID=A0A1F5GJW7_9BACT|nr:MAG: hypothetical protein A2693_00240 [Candidatus Curtissbacteria bacterium RIFCSPHIGHO2_01_FULL_40_12]OGD92161.1 MAG: hypothetical protein A3D81_02905 [Candidatus Curtissbacteria bacterium RIFCSPHIGHO2_02_FULL_40_17]